MRFVAVEYPYTGTNKNVKGYIRIPEDFHSSWSVGYVNYLRQEKGIKGDIKIYPLHVHLNSDTMGKAIIGYTNLEDEFMLALRSTKYYPEDSFNDSLRRQWAAMDPMSQTFRIKER